MSLELVLHFLALMLNDLISIIPIDNRYFSAVFPAFISKPRFMGNIATHPPILLGYPDAKIYNFDTAPLSDLL